MQPVGLVQESSVRARRGEGRASAPMLLRLLEANGARCDAKNLIPHDPPISVPQLAQQGGHHFAAPLAVLAAHPALEVGAVDAEPTPARSSHNVPAQLSIKQGLRHKSRSATAQHDESTGLSQKAARYCQRNRINHQEGFVDVLSRLFLPPELQAQYTNYKDTLQQVARKIGDVEQEAEEHK